MCVGVDGGNVNYGIVLFPYYRQELSNFIQTYLKVAV